MTTSSILITKIKFWAKYWWLVLTGRRPTIEVLVRQFSWNKEENHYDTIVYDLHPQAIRNLRLRSFKGQLLLSFDYAKMGSTYSDTFAYGKIIYFGDE